MGVGVDLDDRARVEERTLGVRGLAEQGQLEVDLAAVELVHLLGLEHPGEVLREGLGPGYRGQAGEQAQHERDVRDVREAHRAGGPGCLETVHVLTVPVDEPLDEHDLERAAVRARGVGLERAAPQAVARVLERERGLGGGGVAPYRHREDLVAERRERPVVGPRDRCGRALDRRDLVRGRGTRGAPGEHEKCAHGRRASHVPSDHVSAGSASSFASASRASRACSSRLEISLGSKSSSSSGSVGGSSVRSFANTAHATATSGRATTAPRIPAMSVPPVTTSATTTGCSETCLPMMSGWSTCPSSWPMRAIPMPTSAATTGPSAAKATIIAMIIAAGAPNSGMNVPMNTRTASGATSGTWRTARMIPARIALQNAMMTVPRAKPEKVYHPIPPAVCHVWRTPLGSWLRNQCHIVAPRARKNTVQKVASARTMNTIATEPSWEAAFEAIVAELSWSQRSAVCHHSSMSAEVIAQGRGPFSRNAMMSSIPELNWSARSGHWPTTETVMYVMSPPSTRIAETRASAVAAKRGMTFAKSSTSGCSTAVNTSARNTTMNSSWTREVA